ncbi:MAG: hypothetical protein GY835_24610 [bacterium]|nr:hypothetical protein [bacterium]
MSRVLEERMERLHSARERMNRLLQEAGQPPVPARCRGALLRFALEFRIRERRPGWWNFSSAQEAVELGFEPDEVFVPTAGTPTKAKRGTDEKVRVMEERYAAGENLFHPDDNDDD